MYEASPRPGDIYLIEAGTMHSVGSGFVLLEVQQPSDTTYRIHDWGRVGDDGAARELHLDEASACIRYNRFDLPQPSRDALVGPCFKLDVLQMGTALPSDGLRVVVAEKSPTRLIFGDTEHELSAGDIVVLEPSEQVVTLALGSCVLLTEPPSGD
jgi:mannose-6-phosphate isomerase class I